MSINESFGKGAALEWLGEQSRVAPTLIPALSQQEKEKERKAIRRLTPAIRGYARVAHKESLSVQSASKGV